MEGGGRENDPARMNGVFKDRGTNEDPVSRCRLFPREGATQQDLQQGGEGGWSRLGHPLEDLRAEIDAVVPRLHGV